MIKLLILLSFLFWCCPCFAADLTFLRQVYTEVPRQYVKPLDVEEIAVAFLKGINKVDADLRVGDDAGRISLYYRGRLQQSLRKPEDRNDIDAWVGLSAGFMDKATQVSREAFRRDFEMPDLMMQEAMQVLDGDSKFYFSAASAEDNRLKHRRNFAARKEGRNLYLKILSFNNYTLQNIRKAVKEHNDAPGLILDLRGSPGGQLGTAIETADLFLDEGIVVSTRGREEKESVYYNSKDGDVWNGKPMIVLTDGKTASAAEVLAAALQEQGRAKIIGTGTFGKGSVQNLIYLDSGAVISLTNAYFYTPSGRKLDKQGIGPDVCTFEMPEGKDVTLLPSGKDGSCPPEERENTRLELKAAEKMLEM